MIPYENFIFFFIIAILLTPTIILGLRGKRIHTYNALVTVIVLVIVFATKINETISLLLFTCWQVILIKSYLSYRQKKNSSGLFYLAVGLAILPLFIVKVAPFFSLQTMIGFLGVSYLTFKAVQMVIEIRDGLIKELPFSKILYFLLFFPTISSGPIDRYRRFEKDISHPLSKEMYSDMLYQGINKIFIGFLYKFIIGYLINTYIINSEFVLFDTSIWAKMSYMYAYSLYLFFDFAGYSAFAIGVSYIMGIKTPENFNKPFISRNIKDFWNRWHMSLSFWFRDYVYMRFVFLVTKKKWIKDRYIISYLAYFLLFFLMGMWHGFALHYIVYGIYHAFLIICFDIFERLNKKYKFYPKNRWTHALSIFITFNMICFGFYIFSGHLFK